MRKSLTAFAFAAGLSLAGSAPSASDRVRGPARRAAAADPVRSWSAGSTSRIETFTLDNGLRVVVHEDRKAPVVAVSVWYNVGSKDEPAGRPASPICSSISCSTAPRTRRAIISRRCARSARPTSTAPPGSTAPIISRPCRARRSSAALFLESDRMGHLLGAVTQENLDQPDRRRPEREAPGRQRALRPGRICPARRRCSPRAIPIATRRSARWPISTPPRSTTVRDWFREQIRAEQRRPRPRRRHQRRRGAAAGRALFRRHPARARSTRPPPADVPTLPAPRRPGDARPRRQHPALPQLGRARPHRRGPRSRSQVARRVLGGLASSRLDNALVRGEQTAVARHRRRPALPPGQPVRGHRST